MHPAVTAAVLLLLCILNTVTAQDSWIICEMGEHPERPCGDGWSRIDDDRCAKYVDIKYTFDAAQAHCRTLNSDLVSLHGHFQLMEVLCLNGRANPEHTVVWLGTRRSGGGFTNTDQSEYTFVEPIRDSPEEPGDCVEVDFAFGYLTAVSCSKRNYFVCAKNM